MAEVITLPDNESGIRALEAAKAPTRTAGAIEGKIEIGDTIQARGLPNYGEVIGETGTGKMTAWRIREPSGQISAILKRDAELQLKAEAAPSGLYGGKGPADSVFWATAAEPSPKLTPESLMAKISRGEAFTPEEEMLLRQPAYRAVKTAYQEQIAKPAAQAFREATEVRGPTRAEALERWRARERREGDG